MWSPSAPTSNYSQEIISATPSLHMTHTAACVRTLLPSQIKHRLLLRTLYISLPSAGRQGIPERDIYLTFLTLLLTTIRITSSYLITLISSSPNFYLTAPHSTSQMTCALLLIILALSQQPCIVVSSSLQSIKTEASNSKAWNVLPNSIVVDLVVESSVITLHIRIIISLVDLDTLKRIIN